jgi:hypoxanthine phosphoribosyltransferase
LAEQMKCKIVTFDEIYRLMCDFLGITDLISLKVEHWLQTGRTKDEATIRYPLSADITMKKLLLIDDITDTGKSLLTSITYVKKLHPSDLRVATMQYIPQSAVKPDYYAEEVKTWTWFIYPWNWIEDTSTLIIRLMKNHPETEFTLLDLEEGLETLFEIKWQKKMVDYILTVMVEREQIKIKQDHGKSRYKLRMGRVIEL